MNRLMRPVTDRELKAWIAAGAVDRAVGEGLTFVASPMSARSGKASWILRFRIHGRSREKVLGRYPELSLKDARDQDRRDREQIERGVDVAAVKQAEKTMALEVPTVERLGELWFARYIEPRYKHPEVVARVLRRHINPVLGSVAPPDVQPVHVDRVLTRIVAAGAPTVANDALRYMSRMFRMAVRNHWIERNPAADFDLMDAGGEEASRERWLALHELEQLAAAMRHTPNFGRENELAVWLLLALCVRKMESCPHAGRPSISRPVSGRSIARTRRPRRRSASPARACVHRMVEGSARLLFRQTVRPTSPQRTATNPLRARRPRHAQRCAETLEGARHRAPSPCTTCAARRARISPASVLTASSPSVRSITSWATSRASMTDTTTSRSGALRSGRGQHCLSESSEVRAWRLEEDRACRRSPSGYQGNVNVLQFVNDLIASCTPSL